MMTSPNEGAADQVQDNYADRVVRNEGRLQTLEQLMATVRQADRELIQQRADSLAKELETRQATLLALTQEQRDADLREMRDGVQHAHDKGMQALGLLREVYDTALQKNYEQSQTAIEAVNDKCLTRFAQSQKATDALDDRVSHNIEALEQRRVAATAQLRQQVEQWRNSDREARELQAAEYARRLDVLNHAHEKQLEFQANSVTRELWEASEQAWNAREKADHDKLAQLDRALLSMTPLSVSERAHEQMQQRWDAALHSHSEAMQVKVDNQATQIADLKERLDVQGGKATGYTAVYGWGVAALTLLVSLVFLANALFGDARL